MGFRVTDASKWPNGTVPYKFLMPDPAVAAVTELKNLIVTCMRRWEGFVNVGGVTYIQFVESTDDNVKIIDLTQKNVGGSAGGLGQATGTNVSNKFSIKWERTAWFCIPHELGHVLGLAHENERSPQLANCPYTESAVPQMCVDMRNDMGSISWAGAKSSQKKYVAAGAYDVNSIMHYPKFGAWTWNCGNSQIASVLQGLGLSINYPTLEEVVGSRWQPSAGDILTLQNLYAPPPAPPTTTTTPPPTTTTT